MINLKKLNRKSASHLPPTLSSLLSIPATAPYFHPLFSIFQILPHRYLKFTLPVQQKRGRGGGGGLKYDNITEQISLTDCCYFLLLGKRWWDFLPNSIKNSVSLKKFKTKINSWAFDCCPCRICKKYVRRVGFI